MPEPLFSEGGGGLPCIEKHGCDAEPSIGAIREGGGLFCGILNEFGCMDAIGPPPPPPMFTFGGFGLGGCFDTGGCFATGGCFIITGFGGGGGGAGVDGRV